MSDKIGFHKIRKSFHNNVLFTLTTFFSKFFFETLRKVNDDASKEMMSHKNFQNPKKCSHRQ